MIKIIVKKQLNDYYTGHFKDLKERGLMYGKACSQKADQASQEAKGLF